MVYMPEPVLSSTDHTTGGSATKLKPVTTLCRIVAACCIPVATEYPSPAQFAERMSEEHVKSRLVVPSVRVKAYIYGVDYSNENQGELRALSAYRKRCSGTVGFTA